MNMQYGLTQAYKSPTRNYGLANSSGGYNFVFDSRHYGIYETAIIYSFTITVSLIELFSYGARPLG